jgi:hypothetical protein
MSDTSAVVSVAPKQRTYSEEAGKEVGLPSPDSMNYMVTVAEYLVGSALYTSDMGSNVVAVKANAMAKMLTGYELGIPPMESLQSIDIVKGKIFLRYPLMMKLILRDKVKVDIIKDGNDGCEMKFTRPDGFEYVSRFGPEDARRAGLDRPDSQYTLRPGTMYRARTISQAFRVLGVRGGMYETESELEEIRSREPEPQEEKPKPLELYPVGKKAEAEPPPPAAPLPPAAPPTQAVAPATPTHLAAEVAPPPKEKPVEPEPAKVESLGDQIKARMSKVKAALMPWLEDGRQAQSVVINFVKGYLNVKNIPRDATPEEFVMPVAALEEALAKAKQALMEEPYQLGRHMAVERQSKSLATLPTVQLDPRIRVLEKTYPQLSAEELQRAIQVSEARSLTPEELKEWTDHLDLTKAPAPELVAFLRMAKQSREAYQVVHIRDESGEPLVSLLAELDKRALHDYGIGFEKLGEKNSDHLITSFAELKKGEQENEAAQSALFT